MCYSTFVMNIKHIIKKVMEILSNGNVPNEESIKVFGSNTKMFLIKSVENYLYRNREKVYGNMSDDIRYEEFKKIAKKKWDILLSAIFSKKVLNNEDINVNQIIVSEIFDFYYKDIIKEIRHNAYDISKGILTTKRLNEFNKNIDCFYEFLTMKERKGIKLIFNVDKYGKDFIMTELRSLLKRLIEEKEKGVRYYKNY